MKLDRWEKIKAEYIDVQEGAYELQPIQNRLDVITQDFPTWDIERQIEELEEKMARNETFIKLQRLKGTLSSLKTELQVTENLVRDYMINNGIKKIEWNDKVLEIQNRKSVETEVEYLNEIPEEYIRTTKELNKIEAKRMYIETGVLIPGVKFIHKDNYSLKIKEGKW